MHMENDELACLLDAAKLADVGFALRFEAPQDGVRPGVAVVEERGVVITSLLEVMSQKRVPLHARADRNA